MFIECVNSKLQCLERLFFCCGAEVEVVEEEVLSLRVAVYGQRICGVG